MKQVLIMPNLRGFPRALSLITILFLAGFALACDEGPVLVSGDQAATHGGMEFQVSEYTIRYLELTDDSGETFEYPNPVLAVQLTVTNRGEAPFDYRPTHSSQQISEATTPVLFPGPTSEEADFRQHSRSPLSGIFLERGNLEGQVQSTTTLAPGESLSDIFLFQIPEANQDTLILSIPPTFHRASLPLFKEIRYREPRPQGPRVHAVGNAIPFDGVVFTVTAVTQEYIKLTDSNQGEGFSTEPILKLAYTVANETEETITFDPGHRDISGRQGAILHSLHREFNRARFPATATPEGQKSRSQIEAGETLEDFAIFERPDESVESATFELAASHFQRSGRVRVNIAYEVEEVEQPEEMKEN